MEKAPFYIVFVLDFPIAIFQQCSLKLLIPINENADDKERYNSLEALIVNYLFYLFLKIRLLVCRSVF